MFIISHVSHVGHVTHVGHVGHVVLETLWIICLKDLTSHFTLSSHLLLPENLQHSQQIRKRSTSCLWCMYEFKKKDRTWFIASFWKSFLHILFEGILKDSVRFCWVMYLKWFHLRNCCSLAQAADWFSCGCLCWSFSVVVAYFCRAWWFP